MTRGWTRHFSLRHQCTTWKSSTSTMCYWRFLQRDVIRRRSNCVIVGASGAGKSSWICTLTHGLGVHFIGTVVQLKKVKSKISFLVFDDFDFSDVSIDDCKRLFDREYGYQQIKVRYTDATLHCSTCRIVLCNELPAQFENAAVRSRFIMLYLTADMFDREGPRIGLDNFYEDPDDCDDEETLMLLRA